MTEQSKFLDVWGAHILYASDVLHAQTATLVPCATRHANNMCARCSLLAARCSLLALLACRRVGFTSRCIAHLWSDRSSSSPWSWGSQSARRGGGRSAESSTSCRSASMPASGSRSSCPRTEDGGRRMELLVFTPWHSGLGTRGTVSQFTLQATSPDVSRLHPAAGGGGGGRSRGAG